MAEIERQMKVEAKNGYTSKYKRLSKKLGYLDEQLHPEVYARTRELHKKK
ncbi:hypothetical protein SEA_SIXAMA_80 [Gordonia phage Sixama]|uniref:Uncharacterized protein n=1 Tax=Gordonia phage Sixama TaxID=2653271 RepID=A0A5Q2F157_9CAUD|nr:hypothetical protein PP302_gp080 [Gordonia phage Sixama]QGF20259.1 hypothetical protein SEA_SIXAMA_80 [Gordonia phage Sixama]